MSSHLAKPPRQLATWLALALILAVGAFTHLTHLDLIEFKADEAQVAGLALAAAHGQWPAASIASSNGGLDNPPLPLYLFALPALFSRDPAWQAAVSALLDLLAILLTFLIGRRCFGDRVGLAAAGFYAAAAYPAMFARKLAGPYLQPFFAALLLAAVLAIASRRKPSLWLWFGAVLALAGLVQIHLGALLLAPVLVVLLAADVWRWRSWRPVLGGAGGALAGVALFAPYLLFEVSRRPNFLAQIVGYAAGTPGWTLEAFRFVWTTVSSPGYGDLMGTAAGVFNAEAWPAVYVAALAGLAVLGGLLVALRRWRDPRHAVLALLVLGPLVLTLHHGPGLEIHYFAFLLPALFLLAGIGFDALLGVALRLRLPAFALLGLLLAVQVADFRHFSQFVQSHALPDSYGLPLAYQERLFGQALRLAGHGRVVAGVANRDQAQAASYFLAGQPSAKSDPDAGLLLPAEGGVYAGLSRSTPAAHALETALEPAYAEPLPGGGQAAVYQLAPDTLPAVAAGIGVPPAPPVTSQASVSQLASDSLPAVARSIGVSQAAPVTGQASASQLASDSLPAVAAGIGAGDSPRGSWANGVQLLGATAPRALPAQLASVWRVGRAVDPSTLFFSQVVDDGGRQWYDHDAAPAPAASWRPGDGLLLLTPAALPGGAPRQEYWWTAGMYVEGGRRVALAGGASELRLARLKGGASAPAPAGLTPASEVFGGVIRLQGWAVAPGAVTLEWACLAPIDKDYTIFVHALGPDGRVLAQSDAQPERYPTSLWDPGETVLDRHSLDVPASAALEVGLYDLASGQRLRLADGADHVLLTQAAAR